MRLKSTIEIAKFPLFQNVNRNLYSQARTMSAIDLNISC